MQITMNYTSAGWWLWAMASWIVSRTVVQVSHSCSQRCWCKYPCHGDSCYHQTGTNHPVQEIGSPLCMLLYAKICTNYSFHNHSVCAATGWKTNAYATLPWKRKNPRGLQCELNSAMRKAYLTEGQPAREMKWSFCWSQYKKTQMRV